MNDRALELFKQAGAVAYQVCEKHDHKVSENDAIWVSIMASTLAELVVKECITHIEADRLEKVYQRDTEYDDGYLDGMGYSERILKEHFGVTE